jgi:hypothetical protein
MTPSNDEPLDDYEELIACFNAHDGEIDPADIKEKTLLELGRDPNSVDIITTMKGLAWERAWALRAAGHVGKAPAPFLSRECLIENKLATGRERDYLDLKGIGAEFKKP